MSDDIAGRLRKEVAKAENDGRLPSWELAKCAWAAADEIERLQAKVVRLESFLHPIRTIIDGLTVHGE